MKKILAVLVILMLILTVFAACGRRKGTMVGTDSFPNLPSVSSKVNSTGNGGGSSTGTGTTSKEITSSEIENAWGDTSLGTGTGDGGGTSSNTPSGTSSNTPSGTSSNTSSSVTSSGGNSGNTSSSSKPGSTSSSGPVYDPNTSSNQGFKPYYPLI